MDNNQKTALDVLNEKFNIIKKIQQLKKYLFDEIIFSSSRAQFTFANFFNLFIKKWNFNTTLHEKTIDMLNEISNNLNLDLISKEDLNNVEIFINLKNFLEVVVNMKNHIDKHIKSNIVSIKNLFIDFYFNDNYEFLSKLITKIIYELMLDIKVLNGWFTLYKRDTIIDYVIPLVEEPIQIQIIKYQFEQNINEKRKILSFISTQLNIEKKEKFYPNYKQDYILSHYLDNSTKLLNKLNIRHPNPENILNYTEIELINIYDALFNQMLMVVLVNNNKENEQLIKSLNLI